MSTTRLIQNNINIEISALFRSLGKYHQLMITQNNSKF